jgi:hypothetical protein
MENHLVTCAHNVCSGREMWAIGRAPALFKVLLQNEITLAADTVAFPISPDNWGRLQISIGRLGPLGQGGVTTTVISGVDKRYSVGKAIADPTMMGRMHYAASTAPGFSGSPYMNGSTVVGMHCHGGTRAGGYESLYLWQRLKIELEQVPESSEQYILEELTNKNFSVENLHDDSIVRVVTGHYYRASTEVMSSIEKSLRERQIAQNLAFRAAPTTKRADRAADFSWADDYDDYEPETAGANAVRINDGAAKVGWSGEGQCPEAREKSLPRGQRSQVSNSGAASQPRQPTERERLMRNLSQVSTAQLANFVEWHKGSGAVPKRSNASQGGSNPPSGNSSQQTHPPQQNSTPSGSNRPAPTNSGAHTRSRSN